MKKCVMMLVGAALVLVMASGCERLPVDINFDTYPDLKVILHKLDGSPFAGVSCAVLDPAGEATSNGNGEATLWVYRDGRSVTVTFTFWQKTPDGTRQVTDTRRLGLPNRGLNTYHISLADRAIY